MVIKSKVSLGLDIDSHKIKLIRMNNNSICNKWIIESIPNGLITRDRILSEDLLGQHIREIIRLYKIREKRCALCLPAHHVTIKGITLPKMQKEILMENILYDIREYLPLELDNYTIDYRIMNTTTINDIEYWDILVVVVLKEVISSYIRVLKKAGLKPIFLDIPFNCMQKLLIKFSDNSKQKILKSGNLCLVDLGHYYNEIIIVQKGIYFANRTVANEEEKTDLSQIRDEILGIIRYFNNQASSNNQLDHIIIFGEEASWELLELLKQDLKLGVSLWTDWVNFNNLFSDYYPVKRIISLSKAIGATIRRIAL